MDFTKPGILEIDGERAGFKPIEICQSYYKPMIITGEIMTLFNESNGVKYHNIHADDVFITLQNGVEVVAVILEDNDKYTRGIYDLDTIQVNALIDLLEGENIEFYYKED